MKRVLIALALAVVCACEQQSAPVAPPAPAAAPTATAPAASSLSGEGIVRRGVGPECADTWSVETAAGELVWPVTDPELQHEGLRVRFEAHRNEGAMSFCMAGTNVDFTRLERVGGETPVGLWNTAWRLQDLGGLGVLGDAEATLEFPEEGKAAGSATCNRFFASVTVSGDAIHFAEMGSTRMACAEALANQETNYLKALERAESFVIEGDTLAIHSRDLPAPLLFSRTDPSPPSSP